MLSSFQPISSPDSIILILGSMPGVKSLDAQQYYAHPRNLFWPFMGQLFNFDDNVSYQEKSNQLKKNKVAIWDVLQNCLRDGSLDSDIKTESIVTNDFLKFYQQHKQIKQVFFNGQKAMTVYNKLVLPNVSLHYPYIEHIGLPSTSPANASIKREEKFKRWQKVKFTK